MLLFDCEAVSHAALGVRHRVCAKPAQRSQPLVRHVVDVRLGDAIAELFERRGRCEGYPHRFDGRAHASGIRGDQGRIGEIINVVEVVVDRTGREVGSLEDIVDAELGWSLFSEHFRCD